MTLLPLLTWLERRWARARWLKQHRTGRFQEPALSAHLLHDLNTQGPALAAFAARGSRDTRPTPRVQSESKRLREVRV